MRRLLTSLRPPGADARGLASAAFALALGAALLGGAAIPRAAVAASQPQPGPGPRMVAILLAPFLTWDDLSPTRTPALWSLAENGALANMNAITADPGWPTVAGGALTLSAGRWAAAAEGEPAWARSLDAQRSANAGSLAVPDIGALGAAVRAAGGHTAAVGTSDRGFTLASPTADGVQRPAELVAGDRSGGIDASATSDELLVADASAPLGVRTDPARVASAVASAVAQLEAAGGPALIVVDPGDLSRAHDAASQPGVSAARMASDHAAGIASLDSAAASLRSELPSSALLLVVAPSTDKPYYEAPYFAPTIAFGPGVQGSLTSGSTHRPGLVTNLDVAPTALSALGIQTPSGMVGQPAYSAAIGGSSAQDIMGRIARLAALNSGVGAVDYLRDLYFIRYYARFAALVALLAAAVAFVKGATRVASTARLTARWGLLAVLSAPPAAWLVLMASGLPPSSAVAASAFGVTWVALFLAAVALSLFRRLPPETPLLALLTLTALLIAADQWLGHPLETGLFSYSIRAGWRYYGMGNEGAAILVGASLAALGITSDLIGERPGASSLRRFGVPAVGVLVLLTAAAPRLGANAGVAVWGVIAFAVAIVRMERVRFTWRAALLTAGAVVGLVAVLVAADLLGSRGSETHVGRFFSGIASGGGAGAWELVRRKVANNIGYVTQTPYTTLALALAAALALVRWLQPQPLARALATRPGYSAALLAVVVGGVAALLTEDSGIVMPALILLAGATPALYLALLPADAS